MYGEDMKNVIKKILLGSYFLLAIFITSYLIFMNDFGVPVFQKISTLTFRDNLHNENSLYIIKKNEITVEKGDQIYFYNSYSSRKNIASGRVKEISYLNEDEITFELDNELYLSSDYLIGASKESIEIPFAGAIVRFFSNSAVYFITFIVPLFVFTILQSNVMKKQR